jgi:hypothetical protein
MKLLPTILLTSFASGLALAAPPETFRPDRYKDLYLKSAITDPPPPPETVDVPSDLPDWTLVAVGKTREGAPEVRIMNMKDRSRITIPSKAASEAGFAIVNIENSRNYLKDSVVTLKKGKIEGDVTFDTKFLVLKTVAAPTAANNNRPNGNDKTPDRNQKGGVPLPPGTRTTASANGAPTTPGAIPTPTPTPSPPAGASTNRTSTNSKTRSSGSSKTKRTRYVPRPK